MELVCLRWVAACFLAFLLGVNLVACGGSVPPTWADTQFSRDAWLSSSQFERGQFYRDLIRSRVLQGATWDEVSDLLGTPDFAQKDCECDDFVEYMLGAGEGGFEPAVYSVRIVFDDTGVVSEVKLVWD